MQGSKLRSVWEGGGGAVNFWLSTGSSVSAEIACGHNFDSLTIDLQHGLADYAAALSMLQAMGRADATPIARVPWLEPGIIMKLLDAGAMGLICPMVNTARQAEQFVRYCRYPPEGERSFGPTRARLLYGDDYSTSANREVVTLAMVETREALDNLEAIVATPGLTGVYIGPSDLAAFLGYSPRDQEEPVVVAAIKRVLDAGKSAGIKVGIHCSSPHHAMRRLDEGFDLVTPSTDVMVLSGALADLMKTMGR